MSDQAPHVSDAALEFILIMGHCGKPGSGLPTGVTLGFTFTSEMPTKVNQWE